MKVLVIDDDVLLLSAIRMILEENGHDVDCCDQARDAIVMVETGDYDFALVDYKMPENNGMWFMSNAKIPRRTKVLLSTAYANREIINRMFELGASGYLIKPFNEDELLHHLEYYSRDVD